MSTVAAAKSRLRGVVFDMDGTLTVPVIDFAAMYKAVLGDVEYKRIKAENPSGIDILHHIESWSPEKQQEAYKIIADFEKQGLDRLQIMPDPLCVWRILRDNRISISMSKHKYLKKIEELKHNRRGLITRNVKDAVDLFHQRFGMMFSPALSRDFRPYKPSPAPLLHICSTWDVQPNEVMMVGDSLKDDVACGKNAGALTCLLDEKGRYGSQDFANLDLTPDFKVSSLIEGAKREIFCSWITKGFCVLLNKEHAGMYFILGTFVVHVDVLL
ncbi:hypothetical protein Gotur_030645 [Gossypium turneri]